MALRVCTWNLNGLDPEQLDERSEAACLALLLRETVPDVVLLQEVTPRTWHAHIKHHFAAAGFLAVPADPVAATDSEYFCVLLVRKPHAVARGGAEPFPNSQMGRRLVWAEVAHEGATWLLATSHLESTSAASRVRTAQLQAVVAGLVGHPGPALFGGDTNLRKAEEPDVAGLDGVVDAWRAAGAHPEHRATWPSEPRGGRPGARFDRVLVKGLTVGGFTLLGRSAPGFPRPPSDHLGVEVVVSA